MRLFKILVLHSYNIMKYMLCSYQWPITRLSRLILLEFLVWRAFKLKVWSTVKLKHFHLEPSNDKRILRKTLQ